MVAGGRWREEGREVEEGREERGGEGVSSVKITHDQNSYCRLG